MSEIVQLYKGKDRTVKVYPKTIASEVYIDENTILTDAMNEKIDSSSIIDDLTTGGISKPLSAEQGKILNESIKDLKNKTVGLRNDKICTNAVLIMEEYDGITGVISGQTSNLPEGFSVGIREQFRYDGNNYGVRLLDTQSNNEWFNFYNGVNWCGWIKNIDDRGGVFKDDLKVIKNDGYIQVEDLSGRKIAMHTNDRFGWIHLFNEGNQVVNDLTLNPDGTITSMGTSLTKIPCCKVYHPSSQVLPGNSIKNTLAWDNILFSSHEGMCANYGTSANIIAPETGIYQFEATITCLGATGQIQADLSKNNAELIDSNYLICTSGGTNTVKISGMYPMNKGEYVQIHFYYNGSNSITISNSSRFQAFLVRGKI